MYYSDPLINDITYPTLSFIQISLPESSQIKLYPYSFNADFTVETPLTTFTTCKDDYLERIDTALGPYEQRMHLTGEKAKSNPFESISVEMNVGKVFKELNSVFINRAALKLANLDLLFNLTENVNVFIDACGGPGGFTQYLQYRLPEARGYGVTKTYPVGSSNNLNWRKEALDLTRFIILTGIDGSGDILRVVPEVSNIVLKIGKVDLVVGDGGVEDMKEDEVVGLVLAQIYLALATLRDGGKFIVKLSTSSDSKTAYLIYLVSKVFTTIYLLKPLTSRQMNTEQYLVAINYTKNEEVLGVVGRGYLNGKIEPSFPSLEGKEIKEGFRQWLTAMNDRMCNLRRTMADRYIEISKTGIIRGGARYANHKVLALLDLPGPALIQYSKEK